MEHRIFGKKLGRTHNQRQALLKGLVRNMFTHGAINTTEAKAKSVLRLVESLSTLAAKGDLNSRRQIFRYLQDQHWVNRVVLAIQTTFAGQSSNFIKITKVKRRLGDDSIVVKMSFVKPITFAVAKVEVDPKDTKTKIKAVSKAKTVKTAKTPKETK